MIDDARLEQRLKRLERQLALARETAGLEIWAFAFAGPRVAESYLVPEDETAGSSECVRFVDAMESAGVRGAAREALVAALQARVDAKASDFAIEYRQTRSDGVVQWRIARGRIRYSDGGVPAALEGTAIDLIHGEELERAAQEALRNQEWRELSVVGSKACIWDLWLDDGTLGNSRSTFTNLYELHGYSEADNTNHFLSALGTLIPPEDQAALMGELQGILDGSSSEWEITTRTRYRDGSDCQLMSRGVIRRDAEGHARRLTGVSIDMTERMRAERALRESEERFRGLYQNAALGFAVTDGEGYFLDCNEMLCNVVGRTHDEIVGQFSPEILVPHNIAAARERIRQLAAGEVSQQSYERPLVRKDGTTIWLNTTFSVVSRNPIRLLGVFQDITARVAANHALRDSEERFRAVFENAGVGFSIATAEGTFVDCNDTLCQLVGIPRDELIGQHAPAILVPDQVEAATERIRQLVAGEATRQTFDYKIRRSDGTEVWCNLTFTAMSHDAAGKAVRILGVLQDITERKNLEDAARRVKERLELGVRNSGTTIFDLDIPQPDLATSAGQTPRHGPKATLTLVGWENFGYPADTDITEPDRVGGMLHHPDDHANADAVTQGYLSGALPKLETEYRIRHADGTYSWRLVRGQALRDARGFPTRLIGSMVDITEIKKLEDDLRRTKERLELGVRGSGTTVFDLELPRGEVDRPGVSAGQARSTLTLIGWENFGYDPATAITDTVRIGDMLQHPEDRDHAREATEAYLRGETPALESEYRTLNADGSIHWRLCRGQALRDPAGRPTRLIGSLVDITRQKRIETDLRESEQRFRATFENSAVGFAITDENAVCIDCNETLCNLFGVARDELVGQSGPTPLFSEAIAADCDDPLRQLRDGKIAKHTAERRFRRKDGTERWVSVTLSVMSRDPVGLTLRVLGIYLDITERMSLEEDLRRARERMELGIRGSGTTIFEIELANERLEKSTLSLINGWEQFGYMPPPPIKDAEQVRATIVHPDDQATSHATTAKYLRGETPTFESEYRIIHKDGTISWWLTRGEAIRDATGRPQRLLGSMVNITEIKRIEGELQAARRSAELANRAKDEFLANVSHEIRTPMNAILGMTELALEASESAHQRHLLSTVKVATRNLLHVINDLLDFSKITAGKLALDHADFSLRAAIADTVRALAVRAHRKDLELVCDVKPEVPDLYFGDAGRVRQVLMNLIGNAIKFTTSGEVVVEVTLDPDASPADETIPLRFIVRDTGIGIAPDKHAAIFHAFEQEDASTTRRFGGTGLGLTISSQLAALMGGSIAVESTPGRGSAFTFTARISRSSQPEMPALSGRGLPEDLAVLVVDDNATNRGMLLRWIEHWHASPTGATDAPSTFAAIESARRSGLPHQLVILDGRMPDIDGLSLAGQLRDRYGAAHRVILLSSDPSPALEARSREIGIDAYLLKPVQPAELLDAIWEVMSTAARPEPAPRRREGVEPRPHKRGLHVLVAEDNELNVNLLLELLGQRDHRVEVASDGNSALALAGKSEAAFDVMLLDLHMPEMDGFEVVRAIRASEAGTARHLPIVALTARSSSRDRERAFAAGMDDFLSKPLDVKALWAVIDRVVATVPRAQLLDLRVIAQTCGGRPAVLERLCEMFRRSVPTHVAATRAALDERNFARLQASAHVLAGTLSAFSTIAGALASTLEDAAVDQDLERCVSLVSQVESSCARLLEETRGLTVEALEK